MLCGILVVGAEHWQLVPAASVSTVVSDGAQLADEHCCANTQCSHLSFLPVCVHRWVFVIANHSVIVQVNTMVMCLTGRILYQVIEIGTNRKPVCDFLFAIISN